MVGTVRVVHVKPWCGQGDLAHLHQDDEADTIAWLHHSGERFHVTDGIGPGFPRRELDPVKPRPEPVLDSFARQETAATNTRSGQTAAIRPMAVRRTREATGTRW